MTLTTGPRRRTLAVLVALLTLIGVVIGVLWWRQDRNSTTNPVVQASSSASPEPFTLYSPLPSQALTSPGLVVSSPATTGESGVPTGSGSATGTTARRLAGQNMGIALPSHHFIYGTQQQLNDHLDRVVATGSRWLRLDVIPGSLAPAPNQRDFAALDRAVNAARARGLNVLGILVTLPKWQQGPGGWTTGPTTDDQRQAFASVAAEIVRRYQGKINTWELWNEPNLNQFWSPQPSAADYVKLARMAYPAIKQANPNSTVLLGGLGGQGDEVDVASDLFLAKVYQAGGRPFFDAVAVHQYPAINGASDGSRATMTLGDTKRVRAVMDAHGDVGRQLWLTEVGAMTGGQYAVSPARQAQLLRDAYALWLTIPHRGVAFWYTLRDTVAEKGGDSSGLYHLDGSAKPALSVWQQIARAAPPG